MLLPLRIGKSNGLNKLTLLCTTERTEINMKNSIFTIAFPTEIFEISQKL